jgi:hypothetical protein
MTTQKPPNLDILMIVISSLTLVVSLQWNGLFQSLIQKFYGDNSDKSITMKFLYTVIISVLSSIIILYLSKHSQEIRYLFSKIVPNAGN